MQAAKYANHAWLGSTREAVKARGNGALVGQITWYTSFVLRTCSSNERRVKNQAVLGSVTLGLECSVCVFSCSCVCVCLCVCVYVCVCVCMRVCMHGERIIGGNKQLWYNSSSVCAKQCMWVYCYELIHSCRSTPLELKTSLKIALINRIRGFDLKHSKIKSPCNQNTYKLRNQSNQRSKHRLEHTQVNYITNIGQTF